MIDYLKHIQTKMKYNPPVGIMLDAISKTGVKIIPFYLFLEGISDDGLLHLDTGFEDYDLGFLGEKDMDAISTFPFRNISRSQLQTRLDSGKMCLGVKYQGKLVAFSWCDLDECSYGGCKFPLKYDEAYLFDLYTLSSFRGRGIAPYLRYQMYQELFKLGRKRLYSISNRFHTASIRFKTKINAKILYSGLHLELFKRWHVSSKVKYDKLGRQGTQSLL